MKLIVIASLVVESWSVLLGPLGLGTAPAQIAVAQTTAAAGSAATGATAGTAVAVVVPGATSATGVAGAGSIGVAAAKAVSMLTNPAVAVALGLVTVGAEADASAVTWDCWKPIVHENSTAPSRGRPLIDILNDPVISDYSIGNHSVVVRNRWNESWRIDPLILPWGEVAAHASQIASSPSDLSASSTLQSMNMIEAPKPQIVISGNLLHFK
eukprot:TRINITY_DN4657_c0_g1_i6.p1 TRINITY_DN4657_c0_g1~~TRINITY_DN4657_c0_g1_i6.p1  ORF type:complete len:212 (+),score=33.28 TRINITY_DN4657_c0_g1_i6:66-701(+)